MVKKSSEEMREINEERKKYARLLDATQWSINGISAARSGVYNETPQPLKMAVEKLQESVIVLKEILRSFDPKEDE